MLEADMTRARDDDACPGALQVHQAADGALARMRLPGGMITAAQLQALALAALEFGSPAMELTSRGNIQIRAITDPAGVADAVAAAGLLPSATHERVRNIVASPLSGRRGGLGDVRALVGDLDAAIQARPELAELPGRFWFSLDDGRADVSGLEADVGAHLLDAKHAALLVAGVDTGVRMAVDDVVATLVRVATNFLVAHGKAWRAVELPDVGPLLAGLTPAAEPGATWPPITRPPVGWIKQDDGRVTLGAAVPLGVLQARVAQYLAAIEAPLVVTPWRSVLVCDLDEGVADVALRVLAPSRAGVRRALAVAGRQRLHGQSRLRALARRRPPRRAEAARESVGVHRHFVGCDRACGSPPVGEVLVATADGYRPRQP